MPEIRNRPAKTVGVCESQPLTAEGLRTVLATTPDLVFHSSVASLQSATDLILRDAPAILIVDKSFGIHAVLDWITARRAESLGAQLVIWGVSMTEAEALRLMQAGAKGIIRKSCDPETLLFCLRSVASGSSWMAESVFHETRRTEKAPKADLTPRERQVLELVEQGLKNRDIAQELGIRPGTVKIHLKHVFEKTGIRGRYGLALTVMREKATFDLPRM